MKKIHLPLVFLFLAASVSVVSASEPNAVRTRLLHETAIQGHSCDRGDAWFYPDGSLNQCTLARPSTFGDLRVPRGSVIELWPEGATHRLTLSREAVFAGYRLRGGHGFGRARASTADFYRNGEPRSFSLVRDQLVQGVPCRGGSWNTLTDPTGTGNLVVLYDDGKLQSCKLTRDYGGLRAGQRIALPRLTPASETAKSLPAAQ